MTPENLKKHRQSTDPKAKFLAQNSPSNNETLAYRNAPQFETKNNARTSDNMRDILDWNIANSNMKIDHEIKENLGVINKQLVSNPLEHQSHGFPAKMDSNPMKRGGPLTSSNVRRWKSNAGYNGIPVN